ncbi:DUF2380 domain-containing protein [Corallococcus praedator]|uniref:DUF2380 domain-containing protein n=1 Tax=Corallococcus praedator TaxID=2316724 RepID=A0ABX9QJ78_9BACT|nr:MULTISPECIES: DUF2380 domain-containing protein [Corallococcus]RKH30383.1 DUF2380 domain-containing protein [Corallococcus sp. CA031C]RKI09937.1 DUF2380 domain-containing protein [Corallococcus praedator]
MRAKVVVWCLALLVMGCAGVETSTRSGGARVLRQRASVSEASSERQRTAEKRGRGVVTAARPADEVEGFGREKPDATLSRLAVLDALNEVKGSLDGITHGLPTLTANTRGLGGSDGVFTRYADYGSSQLPWLRGALVNATTLAEAAGAVSDADMSLGLLRMTGPRLQAAMSGATLLAAWVDFLRLAEVVRQECPYYGMERLFVDLDRVQRRMAPAMKALASMEPGQVEATATAMPELMGQLTREFQSIQDGARVAMERAGRVIAAAQFLEMLTMVSTLKVMLPRPPPAAPVTLGVGLVMGSGGVMMGSRVVVSAEWVETMRRLVRAGVISVPVVSAAVRIHAGQVMMAQAHRDLPKGVRDALGDGPEVRGMHETGRAGAGMSDAPKHHVLPDEHRAWFEKRGFTGDMNIDQFCVRLEQAHHEAIHGGGNWRLGRTWPGEWNRMIMGELRRSEAVVGRRLTRNDVLDIVAERMKLYDIPMKFTQGGSR